MASKEKRLAKMSEGARQFLEPDETVRAAMWGQTRMPQGSAIAGWALMLGIVQPRNVIVTDRNVYVLKAGRYRTTKSLGVLAKHPIGSVPVRMSGVHLLTGMKITIGDQPGIWMHPFFRGRAREIADLAQAQVA